MREMLLACVVLVSACLQPESIQCEVGTPNERTCGFDAACDDVHHTCVIPEQLTACAGMADGTECQYTGIPGLCRDQVCLDAGCGDGFVRGDELCDGTDLGMATDCRSLGYYDESPLTCNSACAYDTSACLGYCGDGRVSRGSEYCDGAPPEETCTSFGFGAGFVDCGFCAPALNDCKFFGWHAPKFSPQDLIDIDAAGDDHVYAVGNKALLMRWDGYTWGQVDIASCALATPDTTTFWAVHVKGPGDVWIGGTEPGASFVLHLTGTTCSKSMVSGVTQLRALWVTSATDAWAIVASTIYRYNGSTWSLSDASAPYRYIWASGPNDAYAATQFSVKRWDGFSWSPVTLPEAIDIYALWGTSPTDVYVAGGVNQGYAKVLRYDGTWTQLMPGFTLEGRVTSLSKGNGYLFAGDRYTGAYVFDGTWWSSLEHAGSSLATLVAATPTGRAYSIHTGAAQLHRFSGSTRLALGKTGIDSSTSSAVFQLFVHRSNAIYGIMNSRVYAWDGVPTFNDVIGIADTATSSVADIWVDSAGVVYDLEVGIGLRKRTAAATTSAPGTWVLLDGAATGSRMWGFDGSNIWIANGTTLRQWNGATTSVCATCTVAQPVHDIWGASSTNIFAVGDGGMIVHYNGATWSPQTSPATTPLRAVFGWNNEAVAVGTGTVVYYDGAIWKSLDYPLPHQLTGAWGTKLSDIFVSSQSGELYRYDGMRWAPVDSGANGAIVSISGVGDSPYWFAGSPTTLYRLLRTTAW